MIKYNRNIFKKLVTPLKFKMKIIKNELKIILLIKIIKIWITNNINNNNILHNLTFVILQFPNLKSQI